MTYEDFTAQLDRYAETGVINGQGHFPLTCHMMRCDGKHDKTDARENLRYHFDVRPKKEGGEWGRERRPLPAPYREHLSRWLMEWDCLEHLCHAFERRVWYDAGMRPFVVDHKSGSLAGRLGDITLLCLSTCGRQLITLRVGHWRDLEGYEITLIADESRRDILNKPEWDAYRASNKWHLCDHDWVFINDHFPRVTNMGMQSCWGRRVAISGLVEACLSNWKAFDLKPSREVHGWV